jgi:hypothetical protein
MDNNSKGLPNYNKYKLKEDQSIHLLIQSISKHQSDLATSNLEINSEMEENKKVSLSEADNRFQFHRETSPFYVQFSKLNRTKENHL